MTDDDLTFALQVAGAELGNEPPTADSPLGRLRLFAAAHPDVKLTASHVRQALAGTLDGDSPEFVSGGIPSVAARRH